MIVSRATILIVLATFLLSSDVRAAELFDNGDFEAGTSGFSSDYSYDSVSTTLDGQFSLTTSPNLAHPSWATFDDHTLDPGDTMLVANGTTRAGLTVWRKTVSVVPGEDYTFSAWGASTFSANPAELSFRANDAEFATLLLPVGTGLWTKLSTVINAGANSTLEFEIVDLELNGFGNDFSLDDLSLDGPAVPEPSGLAMVALLGIGLVLRAARSTRRS